MVAEEQIDDAGSVKRLDMVQSGLAWQTHVGRCPPAGGHRPMNMRVSDGT
jgi:hypothetical protein